MGPSAPAAVLHPSHQYFCQHPRTRDSPCANSRESETSEASLDLHGRDVSTSLARKVKLASPRRQYRRRDDDSWQPHELSNRRRLHTSHELPTQRGKRKEETYTKFPKLHKPRPTPQLQLNLGNTLIPRFPLLDSQRITRRAARRGIHDRLGQVPQRDFELNASRAIQSR